MTSVEGTKSVKQILAIIALIIAASSLVEGQTRTGQAALEGEWVGTFELHKVLVYLQVEFKKEDQNTEGTFLMQPSWASGSVTAVHLNSPKFRFELPGGTERLRFDGQLKGKTLSGVVERAGLHGSFQLVRVGQVDPRLYDGYTGAYELGTNRRVFIRRADDLKQERPYSLDRSRLYYVDECGRTRILYPASETTFFSGPARATPVPVELEVTFVRNDQGRVTGLRWREKGQPERFAPRSKLYTQEEVRFHNGDTHLAGRLLMPAGKGPHPAVVLMHGGGAANRNQVYQIVADFFAARGIAALVYDKRGTGSSTGDFVHAWRKSDPSGLAEAEDALAGVEYLRHRSGINPRQVGLWTMSGGVEPALVAASRSRAVGFLILVSAPGVRTTEWYAMTVEAGARAAGSSEAEIQEAINFVNLQIRLAKTGQGQEELAAATEKARHRRWFARTWNWQELQGPDTDPVVFLRKITCPVLALYGELDTAIGPVGPNKAGLEKGLREGGNRDYTLKVFPQGSHQLWLRESGGLKGYRDLKTYVPGYFETMTDWLLKRVEVAR